MQPCRAMPPTRTATSTRRPTPSAWVCCPEQWQALRQKCPREGFGSTYKAPASLSPREPKYAGPRDAHGASLEADSGFQRNEFPWLWLRTCSPQHTCGINLCMMRRLLLASAQHFRCAEGLWISMCALPMMSTTFSLFVSCPAPSNRNADVPPGISTALSLC